jgi:2,3,4,5-tetrahydropyridine-2-carboxylate N-succinyltransferase
MKKPISQYIEEVWNNISSFDIESEEYSKAKKTVKIFLEFLDKGAIRSCTQVKSGEWIVNEWVKKGILLAFKVFHNEVFNIGFAVYYDKIHTKFDSNNWDEENFYKFNIRVLPGSYVRKGAYLGRNVIIMPAFINIGAYIDENTMIDSGTTIGSCAQIGKNCHISSNVVIAGVLEPISSKPVIIEDNCFVGAGSTISEGIIVEEGAVIASGVHITNSTKIVDRVTGEITNGRIPSNSVIVPGSIASSEHSSIHTSCAIIVKKVTKETRNKTSINDLLRNVSV